MKYTWTCAMHGVSGAGDDDSLTRHQDSEHGGTHITVMMQFSGEEEPEDG